MSGSSTLCRAVARASRLKVWNTKPISLLRMRASSSSSSSLTSWLLSQYLPLVGVSRQPIRFISVDLPDPDGPMMATYSPRFMVMSTPETAWISWSPMMYVFHRSYVRMTMPSRFNCSPRSIASFSASACAMGDSRYLLTGRRPVLRLLRHGRLVIYLDLSFVAQRSDHLVTAGNDLVPLFEAAHDFDIGGAGDAGFHFAEFSLAAGDHEHALDLFLAGLLLGGGQLGGGECAAAGLGLRLQIALLPDSQRLNGNGYRILARGSGDLGGAGKARTDLVGWVVHGHHHLEVFGFLAGNGALGSGQAGRPQNGGIADLGHVALEGLVRDGVNSDVRFLTKRHADDVRFIDLYLGGDQGHIRDGHNVASRQVCNAGHHGLALPYGQVGHDSIQGHIGIELVEHVRVLRQHGFRLSHAAL